MTGTASQTAHSSPGRHRKYKEVCKQSITAKVSHFTTLLEENITKYVDNILLQQKSPEESKTEYLREGHTLKILKEDKDSMASVRNLVQEEFLQKAI